MTDKQIRDVHINRDRLWKELHETCEFGKGERWGEYVLIPSFSYFICVYGDLKSTFSEFGSIMFLHSISDATNRPFQASQYSYNKKLITTSGPTDIGMSRLALSDADRQVRDWFVKTAKESLDCKLQVDSEFLKSHDNSQA